MKEDRIEGEKSALARQKPERWSIRTKSDERSEKTGGEGAGRCGKFGVDRSAESSGSAGQTGKRGRATAHKPRNRSASYELPASVEIGGCVCDRAEGGGHDRKKTR